MSPILLNEQDTFVAYSVPGDPTFNLIRMDDVDQQNIHPSDPHFVFAPYDSTLSQDFIRIKADKLSVNIPFQFNLSATLDRYVQSKSDYIKSVRKCINFSRSGNNKVVYSRIKAVNVEGINWYDYFIKLKNKYETAFVYLINVPNTGTWIGASPELLLSWNGGKGQTMALAGTRKTINGSDAKWSDKNISEQQKVSTYIESILDANGVSYHKNPVASRGAGSIEHLCTQYSLSKIKDPMGLLQNLHPTPAVCGLPVLNAKQFISDHENHDRRYYAGYLGPINIHPTSACYVNLRCMELSEHRGFIYVGSGIMKDSDSHDEWLETEDKAGTLLSVVDTTYFCGHGIK